MYVGIHLHGDKMFCITFLMFQGRMVPFGVNFSQFPAKHRDLVLTRDKDEDAPRRESPVNLHNLLMKNENK